MIGTARPRKQARLWCAYAEMTDAFGPAKFVVAVPPRPPNLLHAIGGIGWSCFAMFRRYSALLTLNPVSISCVKAVVTSGW